MKRTVGWSFSVLMFVVVFVLQRRFLKYYRRVVGDYYNTDDAKVSASLWKDLRRVAAIALPTIWSREGVGSCVFVLLFAAKAALRVMSSVADGRLLTTMVMPISVRRRQGGVPLRSALLTKVSVSLLAAVVSGLIEHLRHWLISAYRGRLTRYFHQRFYEKLVYYQSTALDNRLEAADTVIANYCGEFAEHFAELPYYFVLPLLEASTSLIALVRASDRRTAGLMTSVVLVSLGVLRHLSPPFGRIHAAVLEREDEFRKMHTNAITNVEQIAMHNAGHFTRRRMDRQYAFLQTALNEMSLAKGHFEMLEGTVTLVWSAAAYAIASMSSSVSGESTGLRKFFWRRTDEPAKRGTAATTLVKSKAERLSSAVVQLRLIHDFNASVKDFIINFRELSHLSEFTTKLAAFEQTLDSVAQGEFYNVGGFSQASAVKTPNLSTPATRGVVASVQSSRRSGSEPETLVSFCDVDVGNPAGDVLVEGLMLEIRKGQDWAIVGPNGCGKTSVLRLLSQLWPPRRGRVSIDSNVSFCFLPQAPYLLPNSTMVEQICFPSEPSVDMGPMPSTAGEQSKTLTVTKKDRELIREALTLATGSAIVDHLGGWESPMVGLYPDAADRSFDWSSLSGGQRQKLAISRAFYHAKTAELRGECSVCVLDESTSMMDHDAEQQVFLNLKRLNYRFISVTHREEVLKHHTHILTLSRNPQEWDVALVEDIARSPTRTRPASTLHKQPQTSPGP